MNNIKFTYNAAPQGGAIYNQNSIGTVYFTNNTFIYNSANNGRGGAIYHCNGIIIMSNNNFTDNKATINGGAIYIDSTGLPNVIYSSMNLKNCTFANNCMQTIMLEPYIIMAILKPIIAPSTIT